MALRASVTTVVKELSYHLRLVLYACFLAFNTSRSHHDLSYFESPLDCFKNLMDDSDL